MEEKEIMRVDGEDAKVAGTEANYIETIKKLKESTVSKEDYNRVLEENKQLVNTLAEGGSMTQQEEASKPVDVNELRRDIFQNEHLSNLDYWNKALSLRDELIARGESDPFLPVGDVTPITNQDIESANRVASIVRECIEQANGSSEVFTSLLMSRTDDVMLRRR